MEARLPLTRQWKQALTLLSAVALLVAGILIGLYSEDIYRDRLRRDLDAQAQVLAATASAAVFFEDRAAAREYVDAMAANADIEAANIFDAGGQRIARYGRPGSYVATWQEARAGRRWDGRTAATAPIVQDGQTIGMVYLRTTPEPLLTVVARHGGIALLVLMASLLIVVLGSAQAAALRANRLLQSRNEDLAFQIAEREKAEEALRQSQKMEAMGQLTGGVAHDFNNMLMVASGGLDLLDRTTDEERRLRLREGIRQALDRGASLTRQLLAFARRSPLHPEVVDVAERLEGMRLLLDRSLREDIGVEMQIPPDLWPVEIDPSQLEVAILNMAVNARDSMPGGGVIHIVAGNHPGMDEPGLKGDFVKLGVCDNGVGMSPEVLARVFEPFFTTKEVGKGTGLGLSQVYGFIRASGGEIRIDSEPGHGTKVFLYLPRSDKPLPERTASSRPLVAGAGGRVLIVEDDEGVATFVCQMFEELGWRVRRAPTAGSALDLIDADEPFDLVFSDMVMPGEMDGVGLARRIAALRPDLPILLTTGYSEAAITAADEGLRLLAKPYRLEDLAAELDVLRGEERAA
ncbi:MAG: integral rane sensor hybrid histidine kinase [Caulobacter sp.]|nr:integral rane sensor hybrid histidine kinase [Caulobacter sp.]